MTPPSSESGRLTSRKEAEAAVAAAREQLQATLTATDIGTWRWDLTTNNLVTDANLKRLFNIEGGEELPLQRYVDCIIADDRDRIKRAIESAVREGGYYEEQYRVAGPEGTVRWIHARGRVERDGGGTARSFSGVVLDITERKQAEVKLRESEARLRLAMQGGGLAAWEMDLQTRVNRWDERLPALLGVTQEEAKEASARWWEFIHPDDRDRVLEEFSEACDGRGVFDTQFRVTHHSGSTRWLASWGHLVEGDESARMVGLVRDITEGKRAEEALRESETRFKTLADSAPVLMWLNDREGARFVNRAYLEFLGVRDQIDVRKYDWAAFVHPEDRHRYLQAYLNAFEARTSFDEQFRFRRHDGLYRWMRSIGRPRRSTSGELLGYVGATYDITEIKEAQERLERWSIELERAVNVKTVELQQSQERLRALTSELNLAEQRERKRLATELHDHLQQMLVVGKLTIGQGKREVSGVSACEAVLKKIDDILSEALTYSRTLVAELSPPVLRDHGLAASLKWLAEYMQKKHEQTVTVFVPSDQGLDLPEDQRVLLFQSVRELLINSAKHAGTGQATLALELQANRLCVTVRDEGRGFDPAADSGTPSGGISSKFGLYSIQERMRALGGSFHLQSAPGQGTTATLVLPLLGRDVREERDKPGRADICSKPVSPLSPVSSVSHSTRIRVLLVDDHVMVRQGLRSVLDAYADIQVVGEARDGVEAVKLVEEYRPRVVVMDINMPKMNGIEATGQIKHRYPQTVVIGISVNIGDDNGAAMRRAGAAALLSKEAAVEQLYDAIIQEVGAPILPPPP